MKTSITTVTPKLAREWLLKNSANRPLRPSHVETLRASFARGEYVPTHQGIAFDRDGQLIDGQHRLAAIALMAPGFAISMLVTTDLDRSSVFPVVDAVQAKRSTSDVLQIDRGIGETANFLARLYSGTFTGITPIFVAPFVKLIMAEATDLIAFCGTSRRTWSSAPVRAAAVVQMKRGDPDYVKLVYRALVLADFETMPPSAQSLYRSYVSGKVRAATGTDMFARALKVFNPALQKLSKIQINDPGTVIDETRAWLDACMRDPTMRPASGSKRRS